MELVAGSAIRAAAERLAPLLDPTPVERSRAVTSVAGVDVLLKCENLQRTGSFKLRGAFNRIALMTPEERQRGVVCASAGNHAQGVALAAALQGVKARVWMPREAPLPKLEATEAYGAEVVLEGMSFEEALSAAEQAAADSGATFVHPFNHPDVIAGQGTVGLELLDQVPDVATVVVPVGGGGLISGIAVALRERLPHVRIVGVQAAGCAAFAPSIEQGEPVTLGSGSTIADGIAVKRPGDLTLAHVTALVDDFVAVGDDTLARAVVLLLERAKLVVEPAGAAAVAAMISGLEDLRGPVVCVLSGGNIDPLLLQHLVTTGLASEGRFATIRTRVPDRPGELARLLGEVASQRANVVAVEHHRLSSRLRLGTVEVQLEVETRGPEHVAALEQALTASGYEVDLA